MQELKTSNRTVGGQYLNGLWTNANEIWKFLIHIAHSKLLWNNHDNDDDENFGKQNMRNRIFEHQVRYVKEFHGNILGLG